MKNTTLIYPLKVLFVLGEIQDNAVQGCISSTKYVLCKKEIKKKINSTSGLNTGSIGTILNSYTGSAPHEEISPNIFKQHPVQRTLRINL